MSQHLLAQITVEASAEVTKAIPTPVAADVAAESKD